MNIFEVKDKVIVISGATGVLGSAMAKHLAKEGAIIGILGRTPAKNEKLYNEIKAEGNTSIILEADVLDKASLEKAFELLMSKYHKIDVLINCAGGNVAGSVVQPQDTVFDMKMEDLSRAQELNITGTVLPTQIFGKQMASQKFGSVINISSMAAIQSISRVMGYSVAKSAIDGYTRWMALELASKYGDGIRVNAIAPGFFISEQNRALLTEKDGSYTERGQKVINNTSMARFGKADELLGAVQWLCSGASSFVTGTVIPVDGGFSSFSGV